ncbi:TPA: hypothetical protein ACJG4C_004463 [Salmonella enterica subsp. diarizonae serovar 61:r:z53]
MKLTVDDIRFSVRGGSDEVYATVAATIENIFPVCTMNISVPLVKGKALEQYKDELLAKARERIAEIYKEIVCGGNEVGEIVMSAKHLALINSPVRDNLEERVALLESHLYAQIKPEVLNAMYTNIKNIIVDDSLAIRDADGSVRVRVNAEKQTGLKVTVSDKDDVLWMRDRAAQKGIMSLGYLKDGTQQRIIAALEDALFQAKSQLLLSRDDERFWRDQY